MTGAVQNPFLARGKRRPVVVGHRGAPALHQENTLAGFRRAVALGAPAVELDVQLTADGRAVVLHDDELRRLTGERARARDLTWDRLSRLRIRRAVPMGVDVAGNRVVVRYDREESIPLLAEVLAEIAAPTAINVELKLDLERWWDTEVATVVARELVAAGAVHRVIVTSFDPRKLRVAARAAPGLAVGFCFDDSMLDFARPVLDRLYGRRASRADGRPGHPGRRLLTRLLETDLVGRLLSTRLVGAEHTLIAPETVRALHARAVAIGTHTLFPIGSTTGKPIAPSATTVAEVERLIALGVDWIETDDPERVLPIVHAGSA